MAKQTFTKPPVRSGVPAPDSDTATRFVQGAERHEPSPPPPAKSKDVIVWAELDDKTQGYGGAYNMRFTQLEKTCLQLIVKKTPYSQHAFILSALRPALAAKIKELTGEDISALLANHDED